MSAFEFEYEHARDEGVKFLWHVLPIRIHGGKTVERIELSRLVRAEDGSLVPQPDSEFLLETDLVVLSIGQGTHAGFLNESRGMNAKVELEGGRILIDRATGQTSNPKFFAGGDCTNGGREVVDAVADGKRAGIGIAAWLEVQNVQA
jgi:glutamate synthase (NADPH/NADH) small chain